LSRFQGVRGVSYIGAQIGYGLHENTFESVLNMAGICLEASLPFSIEDSKLRWGEVSALQWTGWIFKAVLCGVHLLICLVDFLSSKKDFGMRKGSKLSSKCR
jgi:hypothetical protein